jgi:3-hydroxyphenylacetate 6-hydroxylase
MAGFGANMCGKSADEAYWEDPEQFRPDRWNTPDLQHFTLGLGYRMCVGFNLAYRELYLVFLRTISCFEIQKDGPVDSHPLRGIDDPTVLTIQPKPFKVKFVPRNPQALKEALKSELD